MTPVDDFPIRYAVVTPQLGIADEPRRWFDSLVRTVRHCVTVLVSVSLRLTADTGDVWLRSNVPLRAGLYRLSGSVRTLSGAGVSAVTLLVDDGGLGGTPLRADTPLLVRVLAGSRFGYRVVPAAGAEVDAQIVVEALPDAHILG